MRRAPQLGQNPRFLQENATSQPLEVAVVAAYPEKAVLKATALQVGLEFPVDMVWQGFALLGQLVHKGGVVRFDELVE
jgi:hypothetical protein